MSAHTEASVLAEFVGSMHSLAYTPYEKWLAAALADARNACDESLAEIELLGERLADARNTIEDQRREIEELSAFTQLARDAVNELNDESADVVLTRARAELAKLRPVVEAAREWVEDISRCATDMGEWIDPAKQRIIDAVRAADADGRLES